MEPAFAEEEGASPDDETKDLRVSALQDCRCGQEAGRGGLGRGRRESLMKNPDFRNFCTSITGNLPRLRLTPAGAQSKRAKDEADR